MLKKLCLFSLLFVLMSNAYAQNELNAYKYIIIPKKYDFLKRENQYRLNTLTKYMFDEEGFSTLLKGESYPEDLLSDPCLALRTVVEDYSNIYRTKLKIVLLDCHDNVVFTSQESMSRIKQYDKAYQDALEKSFASVKYMHYKYNPDLRGKSKVSVESEPLAVSGPAESEPDEQEVIPEEVANPEPKDEVTSATVAQSTSSEPKSVEQDGVSAEVAVTEANPEVSKSSVTEPVAKQEVKEPLVIAAAVPVVKDEKEVPKDTENKPETVIARNYENENISFFLIKQGDQLVAYVNESKNADYKKGELIGTFEKTSVPNFFRVSWKKKEQDIDETMAYFDESGNLKIDIHRNGKIEVIVFSEVKE